MTLLWIYVVFIAIALIVVAAKTIAITKEGERLFVFRLGQLIQVYPPGRAFLIPFVDRRVRVNVDQIPGWETLTEDELQQRLSQELMKSQLVFTDTPSNKSWDASRGGVFRMKLL